jgi:uncharacterized protein
MKYLVVLAVVLIVIWLLRNSGRGGRSRSQPPSGTVHAGKPQDMVECPVCLVHLPRSDALPGPDGQFYCCAEHRLRRED